MIYALTLVLAMVLAIVAKLITAGRRARLWETPDHLYPDSLVADETGGDADAGDAGDATDAEFVLPEDLTTLSAEFDDDGVLVGGDLHALETQAVEAFDALRARDDLTADDLANLTALADAVDAIRADSTRRVEEATETATAAEVLANRVHPAASAEGDADADAGDADADAGDAGDADADANVDADAEAVTAAARRRGAAGPIRVPLGRIRDRAPAPVDLGGNTGLPEGMTITAAADVPGVPNGGNITDTSQLATLMHGRARGLSDGGNGAVVASIAVEYPVAVSEEATRATMREAIEEASNPASLVAAGGWCAPSDRVWDFFSEESTGGIWDVPTIGIQRGGLEFPVSPSIGDVFDVPWLWTEDDDIAALGNPHEDPDDDRTKPCFRVPCPTWTEVRLRAHGVCVTAGNLTDAAYPEATRRTIDLVMAAHAHVMNARNLARAVALSSAVAITDKGNAAAQILNTIELQVLDYRDKYRMADTAILEAVFDMWVKGLIRADIARRGGIPIEDVPDSRIVGWFQDRGVRPQFVHDFHPLQTGAAGQDGFREVWPTDVVFLLYAAGTFTKGTGARIDLGVVRDSRLNETNDHTAAWTEEQDLIARVGHESRVVTVPVVPNGLTSAPGAAPAGPLV